MVVEKEAKTGLAKVNDCLINEWMLKVKMNSVLAAAFVVGFIGAASISVKL